MLRTLFKPATLDGVLTRLARLTPASPRRWGTMTPHQAICHLADSFDFALGRRQVSAAPVPPLPKWVLRFIALGLPLPWPKGVPTTPEVDQVDGTGTPPSDFEADRNRLEETIREFAGRSAKEGWPDHPGFDELSHAEWGRWGYRHCDHHFRQFGG